MNIFTIARARRALFMPFMALLALIALAGPAAAQTDPAVTAESTPTPATEPTAVPPPVDARFGVIESYEDPGAAARLGVGWTRVRFQWADVQPGSPDDWEPPVSDEELAAELDVGREVVGLLIGIPDWARDDAGTPRGLGLAYDDPGNTWAVFVSRTVERYAGRIDRWIIWNEPDIDDPNAPGHTWDGSIEEFAQLQRTAYLAGKAANPQAVIHLSAFTYFWDPDHFSSFLDVVAGDPEAAGHNFYFDVATAHLYFQPDAIYNILSIFRGVMSAHGLEQPIWLVETNAPPMDDPYWLVDNWTLAVTLNEQAAFIPQAMAAALAAGVERIAVYKLKDTAGDRAANPEPFGLMRWDNSRRPAFDTYRVAIRRMSGVTAAEREEWAAVGQVRLEQDGQMTTVLFARLPGPQIARVEAIADVAELVDMWGRSETIEAVDGYFTVELPGALCTQTIADYCMIGGTTYYLIQEVSEEYAATRAAMPPTLEPTVVPPPTATAAPASVTPEPTEEPTATPAVEPSLTPTQDTAAVLSDQPESTPVAEPDAAPAPGEETVIPAGYAGLVVLGLGVIAALGMTGWWYANRRGMS